MTEVYVGDTVKILTSEYFAGKEAVVVRSRYTIADSDMHDPSGSFAIHIEGEDYGAKTWYHFGGNGKHSNFHSGSVVPMGGCLLVEVIRRGKGKRKKGLTAFLEEYS